MTTLLMTSPVTLLMTSRNNNKTIDIDLERHCVLRRVDIGMLKTRNIENTDAGMKIIVFGLFITHILNQYYPYVHNYVNILH